MSCISNPRPSLQSLEIQASILRLPPQYKRTVLCFQRFPSEAFMFMLFFLQPSSMRSLLLLFVFSVFLLATDINIMSFFCYPSPPSRKSRQGSEELSKLNKKAKIDFELTTSHYIQSAILFLSFLSMMFITWLQFTRQTNLVTFSTNLNLFKRKSYTYNSNPCLLFLSILIIVLLFSEFEIHHFAYFLIYLKPNLFSILKIVLRARKTVSLWLLYADFLTLLMCATTPGSHLICLSVLQFFCYQFTNSRPSWLTLLLILMANDIEVHPGPEYIKKNLRFMNWNLNSLSKNNFERVQFLEAHNSLFDYDIISLCESSLTESITSQVPKIEGFEFISSNHPDNVAHGGVAVYYKDNLPVTIRRDISINESIVLELNFGRKKIFFTVLYRSPSVKQSFPEFNELIKKFTDMHSRIKLENSYAMFFIGSLALMGFPFLTGFYSKDVILEIAYAHYSIHGHFAHWLGTLAAFFTAFYSMRLLYLTFLSETNSYRQIMVNAHDAPFAMGFPLFVLSLGSIFIGYLTKDMIIGVGTSFWGNALFTHPDHLTLLEAEFIPHHIKLVPVIFSLSGAISAFFLYKNHNRWLYEIKVHPFGRKLYTFLNRKWFFDKVYNEYVTQEMLHFGYHTSYKLIDRGVFEFLGPLGMSRMVSKRGNELVSLQTGFLYHYAFVMLLALTFLIAILGLWEAISGYVDGRLFFLLFIAGIASTHFFRHQEESFMKKR